MRERKLFGFLLIILLKLFQNSWQPPDENPFTFGVLKLGKTSNKINLEITVKDQTCLSSHWDNPKNVKPVPVVTVLATFTLKQGEQLYTSTKYR
jgi:hypothetical protein